MKIIKPREFLRLRMNKQPQSQTRYAGPSYDEGPAPPKENGGQYSILHNQCISHCSIWGLAPRELNEQTTCGTVPMLLMV